MKASMILILGKYTQVFWNLILFYFHKKENDYRISFFEN